MARNGNAPGPGTPRREDDNRDKAILARAVDGPGCGHELCVFQRDCLVLQAEVELQAAREGRRHRERMGRCMASLLGLGADEGRLFEVMAYSPDLGCRLAAAGLLVGALERLGERSAA